MSKQFIAFGFVGLLCACESAIPPTRDAGDLANAQNEFDRIAAITDLATPPPGSASFVGEIGSEVDVDGDAGGAFVGALNLTVDFDNTATGVTGSISDITLFDDGVADQNLGGSLAVTGGFDTNLNATATGSLTAVEESGSFGLSGSTDVTLNLTGDLVDDAGTNTLVGQVSGFNDGPSDDFDVFLFGDNGFYARQQ